MQTTALLIIDIQNDYFPKGTNTLAGAEDAAKNALSILNVFRKNNMPVFHVQHIATRPTATFFLPNTFGAEIHEWVKPIGDEPTIIKHVPNSFKDTNLYDLLKANGIQELVVCGMMTHMCVDATVRAAKDLGFTCTLIADACATKNLELHHRQINAREVHDSFIAALGYYYARIVNTADYTNECAL